MTIDLHVTAGSGMQLATIAIDPSRIRGTGGALSPEIEIQCDCAVPARPNEAAIGIERVTLQLWLPRMQPPVPLGLPATRD